MEAFWIPIHLLDIRPNIGHIKFSHKKQLKFKA